MIDPHRLRNLELLDQKNSSSHSKEENQWSATIREFYERRDAWLKERELTWKERKTQERIILKHEMMDTDTFCTDEFVAQRVAQLKEHCCKIYKEIQNRRDKFQHMKIIYADTTTFPPEAERDLHLCFAKLTQFLLTMTHIRGLKREGKRTANLLGKPFNMEQDLDRLLDKYHFLLGVIKNFLLEINSVFPFSENLDKELEDQIQFFSRFHEGDRTETFSVVNSYIQRRKKAESDKTKATPASTSKSNKTHQGCVEGGEAAKPRVTKDIAMAETSTDQDHISKENCLCKGDATVCEEEEDSSSSQPVLSGRHAILECTICNIIFSKKKNFKKHMVSVHNYKL